MSALHFKHVLIGGGPAAGAAAEAIRRHDPQGTILLVGQEVNRPYRRPALSKQYLRRQITRTEMAVHPISWFKELGVQLRTGQRAAHLDVDRHSVILSTGEEVAFDRLLLATGASARPLAIPGADLPNLFTLRTFEDAERLLHAVDQARLAGRRHERGASAASATSHAPTSRRGKAVVIGGGLLAAELCGTLTQTGLEVDLIVGRNWPWYRFAGEATGQFLIHYLQNRGVTVHIGQLPQRLEGDGRVQRVVMADGTSLACDLAVAAVGIVVNRELLRGTPIAAERAILVDEHCRTSAIDIFAAGDCAAVFDPLFGKHRLIDHWDNARVTGAVAGANMAGTTEMRYDVANVFDSTLFDLSMRGWGEPRFVHHRITRGTTNVDAPDFVEIGIAADGRIAQVLSVGHGGDDETLRELVRRRLNVEGKEELLKDPSQDLGQLLI
jgi:3-phenylpropionate/trans-cinnamate dioxygenase ferredoxin reductase subunit